MSVREFCVKEGFRRCEEPCVPVTISTRKYAVTRQIQGISIRLLIYPLITRVVLLACTSDSRVTDECQVMDVNSSDKLTGTVRFTPEMVFSLMVLYEKRTLCGEILEKLGMDLVKIRKAEVGNEVVESVWRRYFEGNGRRRHEIWSSFTEESYYVELCVRHSPHTTQLWAEICPISSSNQSSYGWFYFLTQCNSTISVGHFHVHRQKVVFSISFPATVTLTMSDTSILLYCDIVATYVHCYSQPIQELVKVLETNKCANPRKTILLCRDNLRDMYRRTTIEGLS